MPSLFITDHPSHCPFVATNSPLPGSTQILIKNTFIQFEEADANSKTTDGPRPRGDSCDAVLFSSTPARCQALDALLCIPENPSTLRSVDGDTTDQDSAAGSASTNTLGKENFDTASTVVDLKQGEDTSDRISKMVLEEVCKSARVDYNHSLSLEVIADGQLNNILSESDSIQAARAMEASHQNMTPAELLESLVACEQLKRMPLEDLPAPPHDKTTVMLRNIPNKYTQSMLLEAVNQEFRGLYDFFYLPIDFKNKCNVGYAFINFIHPYYAELFSKKFAGLKLTAFKSKKICEVSWGRVQGLRANIEHYRNSAIMSIPNSQYKPLIFKDGIPLQFPGPAGSVPTVKPRHGRSAPSS